MKKIAILGCENSHADMFLTIIREQYAEEIEVLGVYSHEPEAAQKLHEQFGVPVADSYDAFVGKVDGIVITARHGARHYLYAKPYLDSRIPLFIDKPITVSEADAVEFCNRLKQDGIPACGGSICVFADQVLELQKEIAEQAKGPVLGGMLRAPINLENEHGGFYFYSQHMIQVGASLFGYYPKSVQTFRNGDQITVLLRYENYDVTGLFTDHNYLYYAGVHFKKGVSGSTFGLDHAGEREFAEFYDLLQGKPQHQSYDDLFAPVFILNAIDRSLQSGAEEPVHRAAELGGLA